MPTHADDLKYIILYYYPKYLVEIKYKKKIPYGIEVSNTKNTLISVAYITDSLFECVLLRILEEISDYIKYYRKQYD